MPAGALYAISDLHVAYEENRQIVREMRPASEKDWLIVAGDVAERFEDVRWALGLLAGRFERVVWCPGNHELWTPPDDPVQLRGVARYDALIQMCRELGVTTPEDEYAVWTGEDGPVTLAPLFLLYDYSFLMPGVWTKAESLARAYDAGVVCTDEMLLHPDPFPSREAWCADRLARTERRLAGLPSDQEVILINHFPLVRASTRILRYPEFAQWCGTARTAEWHLRFNARTVVYGHLHIPRTTWHDGVRFEEVSVGYPREWRRREGPAGRLRPVGGTRARSVPRHAGAER
ncbi:metallophosphoesterase family protein [Cryptosporangium sp. NPDC051539]|uniref:metallophosphoesterase family protein n=1 Tax=Cryptosporangium sp. NPDC051539 TaxID=3363962 RepID=UPI00379F5AFA